MLVEKTRPTQCLKVLHSLRVACLDCSGLSHELSRRLAIRRPSARPDTAKPSFHSRTGLYTRRRLSRGAPNQAHRSSSPDHFTQTATFSFALECRARQPLFCDFPCPPSAMVSTSASNNVLVVGSMQNVEAYQAKVLEMKSQAAVGLRSEMLDRILDQGGFTRSLFLGLYYEPD